MNSIAYIARYYGIFSIEMVSQKNRPAREMQDEFFGR